MEIRHTPPPQPRPKVRSAEQVKVEAEMRAAEARQRDLRLRQLSAWFSHQVYSKFTYVRDQMQERGAAHFTQLADGDLSTVAYAFVYEGCAWIVFRGSNDTTDWMRNFTCLPRQHWGIRKCYSLIDQKILDWLSTPGISELPVCLAGHSLGGGLAILAAERLHHIREIKAVSTFGAPRVLSVLEARAFEAATVANGSGDGSRRLSELTVQYVRPLEVVALVPPAFFGFRHVGQRRTIYKPENSGQSASFGDELAYIWKALRESASVGWFFSIMSVAVWMIYRAFVAGDAHSRIEYARNMDPNHIYAFGFDNLAPQLSFLHGVDKPIKGNGKAILLALPFIFLTVVLAITVLGLVYWVIRFVLLNTDFQTLFALSLPVLFIAVVEIAHRRNGIVDRARRANLFVSGIR